MNDSSGMAPTRPIWEQTRKLDSVDELGAWLNTLARLSFLEEGSHPEMYNVVTDTGSLYGAVFNETTSREVKSAAVAELAGQYHPYATFHTRLTTVLNPAIADNAEYADLVFAVSEESENTNDSANCLIVRVETRTGFEKVLVNRVVSVDAKPSLYDTVELYPDPTEIVELGDCEWDYSSWRFVQIEELSNTLWTVFGEDVHEYYDLDSDKPHPVQMASLLKGISGLEHLDEDDYRRLQDSLQMQEYMVMHGSDFLDLFEGSVHERNEWGGEMPGHGGLSNDFLCERSQLPIILEALEEINSRINAIMEKYSK